MITTIPFFLIFSSSSSFYFAMAMLAASYFLCENWFAPTIAVLCSRVGKDRQGTALGLFTVLGGLANAAPAAVGWAVESTQYELRDVLSVGVTSLYLISSLLFFFDLRFNNNKLKDLNE